MTFAGENLTKDRRNAAWWLVAGYTYSQQKMHARAIEAFGELVHLDPNAVDGWKLLAQEHRQAGDPRRALMVLDNARLALRESLATLVLLGDTYTDLACLEEAARLPAGAEDQQRHRLRVERACACVDTDGRYAEAEEWPADGEGFV